ncbi:hypothetical protein RchiOBHm_Chr2g0096381 [Rosa chinensis]|uniref:Uncharacterized protein n=1 Tax=Rosa chinensis TaxID=74649 RepID=A0A2P6RL20_ROSCH|nr:hypothetical protein RchiOBHm_Chr2g0096381 [Rosa chinensis]
MRNRQSILDLLDKGTGRESSEFAGFIFNSRRSQPYQVFGAVLQAYTNFFQKKRRNRHCSLQWGSHHYNSCKQVSAVEIKFTPSRILHTSK